MSISREVIYIDRASLPPNECFRSDLIQIDVGSAGRQRTFQVHKDILCHYSGYFKGALRGHFIEATTGNISLPTDDPDTFEAFVYWTHFRRMPDLELRETLTMLSQLWVFGDARAVPLLQNEAIVELIQTASKHERSFPVEIVPYIYENTRLGSPLRRVIIDLAVGGFGRKVYNFFGNWDKEALIDLGKANWKDRKERGIAGRELQASDYCVEEIADKRQ